MSFLFGFGWENFGFIFLIRHFARNAWPEWDIITWPARVESWVLLAPREFWCCPRAVGPRTASKLPKGRKYPCPRADNVIITFLYRWPGQKWTKNPNFKRDTIDILRTKRSRSHLDPSFYLSPYALKRVPWSLTYVEGKWSKMWKCVPRRHLQIGVLWRKYPWSHGLEV